MARSLWRESVWSLLVIPALLLMSCGASTALTPATPTTPPTATPTPLPSCATILPGAHAAATIAGFSELRFPTGAVDAGPTTSAGGVGQFTIQAYDVCYSGTQDDLVGPFSGHHSVTAYLLGAGFGTALTFPYQGAFQQTCPHYCYDFADNQRYIAFENITDHGSGLITYRLRLAVPPPTPACHVPIYDTNPHPYFTAEAIGSSSPTLVQFPPLTKEGTSDGHMGSVTHYFCSAGTAATISAFMTQSLTAAGWSPGSAHYAPGGCDWSISAGGYGWCLNVSITDPSDWIITTHVPV